MSKKGTATRQRRGSSRSPTLGKLTFSKDDLKFKSLGILFNLRWFFNTRNNNKKIFGLDGEYGLTDEGLIGQTFHKYDDVLLWLVSNPNTLEEVEFVVIDHISDFYIFNF